jgi:hypothetical protein
MMSEEQLPEATVMHMMIDSIAQDQLAEKEDSININVLKFQ